MAMLLAVVLVSTMMTPVLEAEVQAVEDVFVAGGASPLLKEEKSVSAVVGGVLTIADLAGRVGNAIVSAKNAKDSGKGISEICGSAVLGFLDIDSDQGSQPDSDQGCQSDFDKEYIEQLFQGLHTEIKSIQNNIDDLKQDLNDISNSIAAQHDMAEINAFQEKFVGLCNAMFEQYNYLVTKTEEVEDKHQNIGMDGYKGYYDNLYVAAKNVNEKLYDDMTGVNRNLTDKLSIQDLLYKYLSEKGGLSTKDIYEECIAFVENLYATYVFSEYCLLICRIYQLDYCAYYLEDTEDYVVPDTNDHISRTTITNNIEIMVNYHETIVAETLRHIVSKGNSDFDMLYIPQSRPEIYSLKYSDVMHNSIHPCGLYRGDQYFIDYTLPEKYEYILLDEKLRFESSDESVAILTEEGEIQILGKDGDNFLAQMKYGDHVIASYKFVIVENSLFLGGYGIGNSPFLIGSKEELENARSIQTYFHCKLIDNIDLERTSVGGSFFSNFHGVFDGNGYAILNIDINAPAVSNAGFFDILSEDSIVKNLTLQGIMINVDLPAKTQTRNVGVLAGVNEGRIFNCIIETPSIVCNKKDFDVSNTLYIGAVTGSNMGHIENSQTINFNFYIRGDNRVEIRGKSSKIAVGGLVGDTKGSLKNNLVVNPRIKMNVLFGDYWGWAYYDICIGDMIGTKAADALQATYYGGKMDVNVYERNYGVIEPAHYSHYSGSLLATRVPPEMWDQYRLTQTDDEIHINRDVYQSLEFKEVPSVTEIPYGEGLNLSGVQLEVLYSDGSRSMVPITSVSGFDSEKLGKQTITLSYEAGNGELLNTSFEINVVCDHNWDDGIVTEENPGLKTYSCNVCGTQKTESNPTHVPGDINGDGKTNNKDLSLLFQYLSGWDVEVVEAALDINGDGKNNNKDLSLLFQYLSDWDVIIH